MPIPTLQDAVDATKHSRDVIAKKSNNKFREAWDLDRKKKYEDANKLLSAWASETGGPDPTKDPLKYVEHVAKRAGEMQAGNCFQYSCVAFALLKAKAVAPLEIAGAMKLVDMKSFAMVGHHFLLLGRPKDAPLNIVELEKSKWADSIFISDGWAKISCNIKDYRKSWKEKLAKWVDKGKTTEQVLHPVTNQNVTFGKGSGWPELFDDKIELEIAARLDG